MDERCPKCDREGCPALRPGSSWGDTNLDEIRRYYRRARKDCRAHAVDWRARALAAERELAEARARAPFVEAVLVAAFGYCLCRAPKVPLSDAVDALRKFDEAAIAAYRAASTGGKP